MTDLTFDPATLRALLDAMPDAPWRVALSQPNPGIRTAAGWEVVHASYDDHLSVLEFIAAARNELPALLDALAAAREELAEAKTLLHTIWYGTVNAPARERWLRLMRDAVPTAAPQDGEPTPEWIAAAKSAIASREFAAVPGDGEQAAEASTDGPFADCYPCATDMCNTRYCGCACHAAALPTSGQAS